MKVSQSELLNAYRIALIRYGSYSRIEIDAVTRDWCSEIIISLSGEMMFQGTVKQFEESSARFL